MTLDSKHRGASRELKPSARMIKEPQTTEFQDYFEILLITKGNLESRILERLWLLPNHSLDTADINESYESMIYDMIIQLYNPCTEYGENLDDEISKTFFLKTKLYTKKSYFMFLIYFYTFSRLYRNFHRTLCIDAFNDVL